MKVPLLFTRKNTLIFGIYSIISSLPHYFLTPRNADKHRGCDILSEEVTFFIEEKFHKDCRTKTMRPQPSRLRAHLQYRIFLC